VEYSQATAYIKITLEAEIPSIVLQSYFTSGSICHCFYRNGHLYTLKKRITRPYCQLSLHPYTKLSYWEACNQFTTTEISMDVGKIYDAVIVVCKMEMKVKKSDSRFY